MDSITPHCVAVSINNAVFTADSGPPCSAGRALRACAARYFIQIYLADDSEFREKALILPSETLTLIFFSLCLRKKN